MPFHWIVLNGALLVWLLALLYRRQALRNVTYERSLSHSAVFEGDQIQLVERIANRKLLPVPWLRLESLLPAGLIFGNQTNLNVNSGDRFQNHLSLFSLRPFRQIVRRHEIVCARRGLHRLQTVTMTAGEPFGLVRSIRQFPISLELLVYPRGLALQDLPLPSHSWLGSLPVRRWIVEDPFLTAGVREYRPGDSFRSVNWKATARTGSLQVHRRSHTADHRIMICLNVEVTSAMWGAVTDPGRIELGIRYAATVAGFALANGFDAGLLCNGWPAGEAKEPVRLAPAGGPLQHEELLTALAKLQLESTRNMSYLLDNEAAGDAGLADYLIITCHRDEKLLLAAGRLRAQGHGVEWMDIPKRTEVNAV